MRHRRTRATVNGMTETQLLDRAPFSPRVTAAAMAAGGILLLAGLAVTPWEDEATMAAYQDALAAHPTQGQISATLLFLGFLTLPLISIGLHCAVPGRGRLRSTVACVAIFGGLALPGALVSDFYDIALAQELPRAQGVHVAEQAQGYLPAAILSGLGMLSMLGLLGLLVIAWRARVVQLSTPALFVVGWLVPIVGGVGLVPAVIGGVFILAALATGARALLSGASTPLAAARPAPA